MLFIIFGWGGGKATDHGPTVAMRCPNCSNEAWFHLVSSKKTFTLYWIPVAPYGHRHALLCSVCQAGVELEGAKLDQVKRMNQATTRLLAGEITEDDYKRLVAENPPLLE